MRIMVFVSLIFFSFCTVRGQDPIFSQFYNTPLQVNPAFTGNSRGPTFIANYRNQWPAFDAYQTYNVSYDQRFDFFNSGLGFNILSDNAGGGSLRNTKVSGLYSYRLTIDQYSTIKFGLETSFVQSRLDWSKFVFYDQLDPQYGAIGPDGIPFQSSEVPPSADKVSHTYLDISAGVLYYTPQLYAGISFAHMNQPEYSFFDDERNLNPNLPLRTTFIVGNQHTLIKKNDYNYGSYISPSILYARQGDFSQVNAGVLFSLNQLFFGGWYRHSGRTGDAAIVSVGWRYEYLKIGYSFDMTLSDLGIDSGGAHEIGIVVNLDHLYSEGIRYNDCFALFR